MVLRMCSFILFQFSMGTYLLEMNMQWFYWHKPFGCEKVIIYINNNFWLWTCFVHPFEFYIHLFHPWLCFIRLFIHNYCSSMYTRQNIPPCHDIYAMCQRIFFQYSFDVNRIFPKNSFMLTYSCSSFIIPHPNVHVKVFQATIKTNGKTYEKYII
jgi:hypothetical protein